MPEALCVLFLYLKENKKLSKASFLLHFVNIRHVANFDVFPSFFIMCKVFEHLSCSLQKKLPAFLHFVLASCTSSHNFVLMIPFDLEHLSSTLNCLLPQQVTGLKFKASLKLCPVCSRLRLPRAPASQDPSAVPRVQNGWFSLLLYFITTLKPLETTWRLFSKRHIKHIKQNNGNVMVLRSGQGGLSRMGRGISPPPTAQSSCWVTTFKMVMVIKERNWNP